MRKKKQGTCKSLCFFFSELPICGAFGFQGQIRALNNIRSLVGTEASNIKQCYVIFQLCMSSLLVYVSVSSESS
jgi:hypothetical protein